MTKTKNASKETVAEDEAKAKGQGVVSETAKTAKGYSRPAFLAQYIKAYPGERVFHVTSDKQVFFGKDYHLAKLHQNGLGKGQVKTYEI